MTGWSVRSNATTAIVPQASTGNGNSNTPQCQITSDEQEAIQRVIERAQSAERLEKERIE